MQSTYSSQHQANAQIRNSQESVANSGQKINGEHYQDQNTNTEDQEDDNDEGVEDDNSQGETSEAVERGLMKVFQSDGEGQELVIENLNFCITSN